MIGRRKQRAAERTEEERAAAAAERMRRKGLEPSTAAGQDLAGWAAEPPPPRPASRPAPDPADAPGAVDRAGASAPQSREPFDQGEAVDFVVERRRLPQEVAPARSRREAAGEPAAPGRRPDPAEPQPGPEPPPPGAPEPVLPAPDAPPPGRPDPDPARPQAEPEPVPPAAGRSGRRAARRGRSGADAPRPAGARLAPAPREAPGRRAAPPLKTRGSGRAGGAPRAPRRPLPPAARGASRAGRRLLAVTAVLLVVAVGWLGVKTFQPFHEDATGNVDVTVPTGADVGKIGDLLADRGVVDSGTFFSFNATLTGRRGALKPGDYRLRRGMTYGAALEVLTAGPPPQKAVPTFKLTLPEGLSRQELVSRVRRGGVRGDYRRASGSPRALRRARRLGLPRGIRTTEGFLFPATYDLPRGATAADLVDRQLRAYADNVAGVDHRTARRRNLTRYDVLIIASMVEREAQLDRERPLVAAVIHNRLREGMPLGIDATIRYAENNWTSPLKVSELERPGPYNTRLERGLPPTPIGNPGLASIKAAAKPADVGYLFYVVKPGTCGEHAFSSTDAKFQRDRARYEAERAEAGGRSPTKC